MNLIEEAIKRGYKTGSIIDYEGRLVGTDTLGCGEFEVVDGKLIKYESNNKDSSNFRRFDTIFYENGWVKLVDKPHGLHVNSKGKIKQL